MNDVEKIKNDVDLLRLVSQLTNLKKVANTGRGEWAGACPFCGGEDRFRVQEQAPPGKKPQGSRWMCRQCNPRWGDVIGFVVKRDSLEFIDAVELLNPKSFPQQKNNGKDQVTNNVLVDRNQWANTATEFLEESFCHLWSEEGRGALSYLRNRGLNDDTLRQWLVGYNPTEGYGDPQQWGLPKEEKMWIPKGIVVNCVDDSGIHYLKIRRRIGEPKYYILKGGNAWLFGAHTFLRTDVGFLFEGEFDVMLAEQTGFCGVGYASMPANQQFHPEWEKYFSGIENLIVAFDNDEAGQKGAERLCGLSAQILKADPFPFGNDLSDFYQSTNSIEAVFDWLYDQLGHIGGKC